jgi:hypothetical protein
VNRGGITTAWLLLATLAMSCQSSGLREAPGSTFTDEARGISVDVPPGWYAVPAQYSPENYFDVFLTLNNQLPGFRLGDYFGGKRIALQPGMICICIGESGFLTDSAFLHGRAHSFEAAIDRIGDVLAASSTGTLQFAKGSYTRAGRDWETAVYAAAPCTAQDKKQAITIIRGIRFTEAPMAKPGTTKP